MTCYVRVHRQAAHTSWVDVHKWFRKSVPEVMQIYRDIGEGTWDGDVLHRTKCIHGTPCTPVKDTITFHEERP